MDYQSSVEDVNEVTKKVTVSIPAPYVVQQIEAAIEDVAKNAQVKGFRPGKAPINVIRQLHGPRVRLEVANRLISNSLGEVVQANELKIVGAPEIDLSSFEEGKDIQYTANISLLPAPTISAYESFKVEVPPSEVTDAAIDQVIERLRESKAKTKKLEFRTTAKAGDVVDAALTVIVGDTPPERPEPLVVELGSDAIPAELSAGIEGMEIGQTKEISSKVPENHPNEALRGKDAIYKVTLNQLMEKDLPPIDDDFAISVGADAKTLLDLRIKIREKLEEEGKGEEQANIHTAILEQLVEANQFLVPQVIVDEEVRHVLVRYGLINPQKVDPSTVDVTMFRDKLGDAALKRVRTAIIVDRISTQESVEVSDAELDTEMAAVAERHGIQIEEVRKYFREGDRIDSIKDEIRRNKVLELLRERTKVSYKAAEPTVEK